MLFSKTSKLEDILELNDLKIEEIKEAEDEVIVVLKNKYITQSDIADIEEMSRNIGFLLTLIEAQNNNIVLHFTEY